MKIQFENGNKSHEQFMKITKIANWWIKKNKSPFRNWKERS